ncbi:unnamed protein product [Notodromas monacha]|uniref:THO complex subunit 7 n=1 Tax=Notodromas monacha TaxID=399045 RepID=A0A7R9C133_9CRUS|nr:unnamed protein product [Notodromas monacha]CAG0925386.1 unnamed protein product [Notodromas monacha]
MMYKLLIDGEGQGDDRKFATFLRQCKSWIDSNDTSPEFNDRMYDLLMRQFDPMNMVFLKTDAAVEMNKQEKRMYEEEAEALKAKIEAAEADILVAREELEEAKKQRERKSEYDALARIIFTLPDREVTRKELQTSEASVQRLKKVKAEYQLMLSEREVLSRDLMFAACQLKRCLKDKPNTVQLSHVDPDVEMSSV